MIRGVIGALAAIIISAWSFKATAQPSQLFELEWESPSVCPQAVEVNEQIRSLLGIAPGSDLPSHLRAKGMIEPIGERFQLTLSLETGHTKGSRVIASNECSSLGKAAAVVLGLLIRKERDLGRELSDSELGGDIQQPTKPPETPPRVAKPKPAQIRKPNEQQEPIARVQTPDAPTQRQWHLLMRAPTATLDTFTLPELGYGVGVAAGVQYAPWRLFVAGSLWRSQSKTTTSTESYRATFKRQSIEAWGCRGWRWGSYELSPCGLVALDLLGATASGDRLTASSKTTALPSAGGGLVGSWHLAHRVSLFLSLAGRFAIIRPVFVVEGVEGMATTDQTHKVPLGTVLTSFGSEWIF